MMRWSVLLFRMALAGLPAGTDSAKAQQSGDNSGFAQFQPRRDEIEARYSTTYSICLRGSGGVTASMRECASREYRRLDWDLNFSYGAALTRVAAPDGKAALRRFQRTWLSWREACCATEAAAVGGGMASLLVADSCHLNQIIRRTLWLDRYGR